MYIKKIIKRSIKRTSPPGEYARAGLPLTFNERFSWRDCKGLNRVTPTKHEVMVHLMDECEGRGRAPCQRICSLAQMLQHLLRPGARLHQRSPSRVPPAGAARKSFNRELVT